VTFGHAGIVLCSLGKQITLVFAILSRTMSHVTALYRKYRPDSFASVRGQEHIVSVLEGAITKKTIPHALLFSGGRGTGKTTLARIFAAAVGVSGVDVYEIDAASNRGIDDIRALREAVHTMPYESPYKVYIIDEVHMLTKEAFNALLKTLEEPPAHVIFILATTEEAKLLDTIISRCQVFRFRNPSRTILRDTVVDVAKREGFALPLPAAELIALAADGSFRDALGITQKVLMASGDAVGTTDEVAAIIGAPTESLISSVLEAIAGKNVPAGLQAIQTARTAHVEILLFIRLLLEHVRAIMLIRHQSNDKDEILSSYSESTQVYLLTAASSATIINSQLLTRLLRVADETKSAPLPFLPLEILFLELAEK
jgi:DNA polymerase III subunit gamma/tau